MAEQIKNNNLPLNKTPFGLLLEKAGRKERVKKFINDLADNYPALKVRVEQFWNDNQNEFDQLKDTSPDNNFKQFFNKFNHEEDFIDLLTPIILKEIEAVLIVNSGDSEIIKELKETTQEKEHTENLPLFFDDKTGGATWNLFLLDLIKDFYLNYIPSYINTKLNENTVKINELDKAEWKKTLNGLYEDCYSSFTLTEEERDLDNLKIELNDDLNNIKDLVKDKKIDKQWTAIKKLVKKIDELSDNSSPTIKPIDPVKPVDPSPVKPDPQPIPDKKPDPEPIKPIPDPSPSKPDKPNKTPEELAKEKEAQELADLKTNIAKLSLNSEEQKALNNSTTKDQAEAVRTLYNARIKKEQEEAEQKRKEEEARKQKEAEEAEKKRKEEEAKKAEAVKYDKLLADLQGATEINKVENGGEYDKAINDLKPELLPTEKQPANLQGERKKILKKLRDDKKRAEETAKAQKLLNEITNATKLEQLPDDPKIKNAYDDALLADNLKYPALILKKDDKKDEILKANELEKYNNLLTLINDPKLKTFRDLPADFKAGEINALDNNLLPKDKPKENLTARINERRATFFYSLNEPKDGGLKPEDLATALDLIKEDNVWKAEEKNPITIEILNELLELEQPDPATVQDLTDYFISQGGYELGEDVKAEEATFVGDTKWKSGGAILRDCYKRINWYPDRPTFPADLPFPTSSGKTTRVPACIFGSSREKGEDEALHIVIVSPTAAMAQDAYNHHSDWLQYEDWVKGIKWRCPYHERDHGGDYTTAKNDLTYYDTETYTETPNPVKGKPATIKASRDKAVGQKGVNVMEPWAILVFLVREIIKITKIKSSVAGAEKDKLDAGKLVVKAKLINKENSVIFFDESHFAKGGSTTYAKIQELAQKLGYKVIRATATFPKQPFSVSMPKKGERKWMSGLVPEFTTKEGEIIKVNELLKTGKCLIFLPKAELSDKQIKVLKRENVGYLVLDETLELASTGLSHGAPNGYALFGDDRYSMGFSFLIKLCVSVVEIELKKLNKNWFYDGNIQPASLASLTQQSGRVRRLIEGYFIATTKRKMTDPNFIKDIDPADDLASLMVECALSGDVDKLKDPKTNKFFYPSLIEVGGIKKTPTPLLIQAAIALPFADGKGRMPEEILIGLTKGGAGDDLYPKFGVQKKPDSADPDLWARFEGTYKPKEIDPKQAKELLFLMIGNLVSNQKQFPNKITLTLENPLISSAGYKEKGKKETAEYKSAITEIKKVVYGAIAKKIKDPSKNQYNDEKEYKAVVELLTLALNNDKISVEVIREETDKLKNPKNPAEGKLPKDNLTLKINY